MSQTVADITRALDDLAPAALAEAWDNVGLLVGDPKADVTRALVALDATPGVLDQAATLGAEVVVTHHPLLFSATKRLVADGGTLSLVRRLVREGRALVAAHTNLDSAPGGLNDRLAALLGVHETRPLLPSESRALVKLVVYVPVEHAEAVRVAMCDAGAGHIGAYDQCAFAAAGEGTFRPGAGTQPYIGQVGALTRVAEMRVETVVPRARLGAVIAALTVTHPYEEPAFDVLPLDNAWPGAGLGRIGTLETATTVGAFAAKVTQTLGTDRVDVVGHKASTVRTVALCGGGGGDLAERAAALGADVYLTGELKHSQALAAAQRGFSVITAGHFATEHMAVDVLAACLTRSFPALQVQIAEERDPLTRG
jgi:dinuclear metal center YbgI/SA1388 family protein